MTRFLPKETLSQSELKAQLHYDPATGLFTWIKAKPRIHVGMLAGSISKNGYVRITIAGRRFMGQTLAWLYMTGELVIRGIDHRDTVRSNNRWHNLRRASASQNAMNRGMRSDNLTGAKGVCVKKGKTKNPFVAQIGVGGRSRHIGYFATAAEAHSAYAARAKAEFGKFARLA